MIVFAGCQGQGRVAKFSDVHVFDLSTRVWNQISYEYGKSETHTQKRHHTEMLTNAILQALMRNRVRVRRTVCVTMSIAHQLSYLVDMMAGMYPLRMCFFVCEC